MLYFKAAKLRILHLLDFTFIIRLKQVWPFILAPKYYDEGIENRESFDVSALSISWHCPEFMYEKGYKQMTINIQCDYKWLQLKISDIKISATAQRYLSFQKSCFFHACYAKKHNSEIL